MAYVYRHIRLDKNEPFYIGIGMSDDVNYTRAYDKTKRTNFWKEIAKFGFEVEILFDNIGINESFKKEIEFISLYGRKDLGTGTLCNLTDGGEGRSNFKHSEDALKKISESSKGRRHNIGRKQSEETRLKRSIALKGKKRSENTKIKLSLCKMGNKAWLGKCHSEESRKKISDKQTGVPRLYACKKIAETDASGNIIKTYDSIKDAANQIGCSLTGIRNALTGVSKTIFNKHFKYI